MAARASLGQLRHLFNCNCRTFALATNVFPFRWPLQLPYPSPFLLHAPVDAPYFSICLSSVAIAYLWAACAHAWPVAAPHYMPIAPLWHVLAVIGQTQNTPPPEPFLRLTPFGYYKNNFAYKLRHELSELMQLLLLAISASALHSLPTLSPPPPPSFAH